MMVAANVIPMEEAPQPVPSKAVLYAKLARVTGKVQRIEKNGWNSYHEYKYATASDVYDGVRAALAEENVAFIVDMVSAVHEGKRTRLEFDFTFACGDTGAVKVCRWVSESDDNADKGINKASTFAVKYFLIATFLIATGDIKDDPDADAPVPEADKKAKPQRRIDTTEKPAAPKAATNGKPAEVDPGMDAMLPAQPAERVERAYQLCKEIMERPTFDAGYAYLLTLNEVKPDTTAVYIMNRVVAIVEVGAHKKPKSK